MLRFYTISFLFWTCSVFAQESKQLTELNQLIDQWHVSAAKADFKQYFDVTANDFVFLGTAPGERWSKVDFQSFCKPYFDKGKAWDFKPSNRMWNVVADGTVAYFDEDLQTWMESCRGSGICIFIDGEWKIAYYNLTVLIENEKNQEIHKAAQEIMFVPDNTLKSAKNYFYDRLDSIFSSSELKSMWTQLICKRMNWSASDLLLNQAERLSESDLLYVRSFVKGLLNSVPFQYLVGETDFYGLTISCDSRALIPRPETEELVAWISETNAHPKHIIDCCTGTACIALALKSIYASANVQALDYSKEALDLSAENAKKLNLEIELIHEDALNFSPTFLSVARKYDIIVSNPPYIPEKEKSTMSAHVIEHEPLMALFVDDQDPIIFYKELIKFANLKLVKGGYLFLELHELYGEEVKEYLELFEFEHIEIRKDLQGKSRMLKAQKV